MSVWAFLTLLWTYGPEILALCKEVDQIIESEISEEQKRAKLQALTEAMQDARQNKDTRKLNDFFHSGGASS